MPDEYAKWFETHCGDCPEHVAKVNGCPHSEARVKSNFPACHRAWKVEDKK
jgi:hypothetical protein